VSYLSTPRLHFAGKFQADVSTVNNDPEHFDSAKFRSSYQLPGPGATNGWWNPNGTGAWRFFECTVGRVVYADGSICDDPMLDPVVGAPLNDLDSRVEGKLVDLDPEQQMVSQIWGFQVLLGRPGHGFGFRSDFEVAAFSDIWGRFPQKIDDSTFGAFYQSVLNLIEWAGDGGSRFLKELAGKKPPQQLSIKFNVDAFNNDAKSPQFTFGRVVGSIGPHVSGEPRHFVGRCLPVVTAPPGNPPLPFNPAYAQLDDGVLSIDLGNSLPIASPAGPIADQGPLYAALQPASGPPVLLAEIIYQSPDWYAATAGVVSMKLNAGQLKQAQTTPLCVVQSTPNGLQPLLLEVANGEFLRADDFVFRFNPGESKSTKLYATIFGKPAPKQKISLTYDPSAMQAQATAGAVPGPQKVGVPEAAFTFPASLATGADGTVELKMKAGDPGNPRRYIDGQLYGVTYQLGATPPPIGSVQNGNQMLSALVFSGYPEPKSPTWVEHVQPIFEQYANLYPVMRPIVDLSNYASVIGKRSILQKVFSTPITNPNYMPVTRDLSEGKRQMLLKWLAGSPPLYMQLNSVAALCMALQTAIELEHATIPPYLCALYSIKSGCNVEVAELIRSVVMEEMLHMAIVANLLISIGGSPNISHPKFVPRYPGSLPGGLRADLVVHLKRCSIPQIRDCFMSIEAPEQRIEAVKGKVRAHDPNDSSWFTIGWFYNQIERALAELEKTGKITFGHADRQVKDWSGTGKLYVITNFAEAITALNEVRHQGEGRGPLDPDDGEGEFAHFYKFAEIVAGRRLVFHPDKKKFAYDGEVIPFDPDAVWPMMDDPDIAVFSAGSRARVLSEQFAQTYHALLRGLHRTFNGEPGYLREAIGLMYSLDLAARELMTVASGRNDGTTAGPCFSLLVPGLQ